MTKARRRIPELTKKRLMQESGGRCPFCEQADVATLEYHHIDGDTQNSDFSNLLTVCSSCHSKIERGTITALDVAGAKSGPRDKGAMRDDKKPAVSVSIEGSTFKGDIAQNIYKLSRGTKPPPAPVSGTIRANPAKKAYVDYLLAQYHDFRKADPGYGRHVQYKYAVVHEGIRHRFGAKTFDLPEAKFGDLVEYLQGKIDGTIQGKVRRKAGTANYHSFSEHCARFGL